MKLKTKFNNAVPLMFSAMLLASAAGARAEDPLRFRDGDGWTDARRVSERTEGRQVVTLQTAGQTSRALVGGRAILQLSAAVRPSAFLRAHGLRAVAPPGQQFTAASGVLSDDAGVEPLALNARLRMYLVESDRAEDGLAIAVRMSRAREVQAATPDLYLERRATDFEIPPNDPRYGGQWYFSRLKLERAWRVTTGDPATTVVVVDNGCDMDHPDLASQMLGGLDLIGNDDDASYAPNVKGNEHGTACAGVIAATGNNGIGIAGACPQCTLRCVRLFDRDNPMVAISADIAAFDYAFKTNAAVVSNSWGFADPQPVAPLLRKAIEDLLDQGRSGRGAVVVFAAGNENRIVADNEIEAIPGVLNVGAVNNFDEIAPFSNRGNSLSLAAPTGSLTTDISGRDGADPTDYTSLFGGTSAACPVVAGVSALMLSVAPDRSAREIADLLISTSRDAPFASPDENGHDLYYGHGIIDPVAALTALGFEVPEPPPVMKPDAGTKVDAGEERDAGDKEPSRRDAGDDAAEGGEKEDDSGCTVLAVGSTSSHLPVLLWLLALVAIRSFRRSRSTRGSR